MFRSLEDFINMWNYESEATIKIFKNISNDSLDQKVTPDGRTLGFLAWHLTLTLGEMLNKTGLEIDSFSEDAPMPNTIEEISGIYKKSSDSMIEKIKTKWNDEMLLDEVDMYGEKWKKSDILLSLITHQIHHRGQLTVLMRQAGLKVPGVYGPSKEEWQQYGMTPQK